MMKYRYFLILLLPLLFGWQACSQQTKDSAGQPNIVVLIAEDISPALGCYGDSFAITPEIDQLAEGGMVYDFALTTAPICAPSRSCLMTGIYASSLGTQHLRCEIPFPEELLTVPELLSQAGYFTSNRDKTDYNFDPEGRWEHWSSSLAPWRKRVEGQAFYSFINIGPSHEGSVNNLDRYNEFVRDLDPEKFHDPAQVVLPPYYPESEKTREIWAHYYDILSVLDENVGKVLDSLENDGLMDETFVFFIADHGFGMPRFKRWLNVTGMHVPMVVHVPEKYSHLVPDFEAGGHNSGMVSFIDLVPTFLNLAGADLPSYLEGKPLMGEGASSRKLAFGARDRADDMFEMSRSVCDGRYIYIRHFMPHLPYVQPGYIFSDVKESYRELRRLHQAGETDVIQEAMWKAKPIEELYDLENDPQEVHNLAGDPSYAAVKKQLSGEMHRWMIEHSDLGLLPESEYLRRSGGSAPYSYARNSGDYAVEGILAAAESVGRAGEAELLPGLKDSDSGVRYWTVIGLMQPETLSDESLDALGELLDDESPAVQVVAAEAICRHQASEEALAALGRNVQSDDVRLALEAARSILLIGEQARPLIPRMYAVLEANLGDGSRHRKYLDFNYSAFTSWALEWALQELGEDVKLN